jgi:hypothetical protein
LFLGIVLRAVGLLQSAKNTAELPERKKNDLIFYKNFK